MKQQNNFLQRLSGLSILLLTSCFFLLFTGMQKAIAQPQFYNTNVAGTGNAFPLNSATNKVQWIYGPGLFNSAGTTGTPAYNGNITTIYLKISTTASATAVYSNFTVKLSQNLGTQSTWAPATGTIPFHTGMTTCFFAASHSLTGVVASSWYPIVLQTPFTYDPALSLQIEVSVTAGTGNTVAQVTTAGSMQRLYAASTATSGTANTGLMMLGMDLVSTAPCVDPPTPGTATVSSSNVCTGQSAILNLVGNSIGSGQDYQWGSSAVSGGPYAPVGPTSSSSALVINPTSSAYYSCEVKCGVTTLPSTEVFVNVPTPFPGGYYTIDNTLSTGSGNFASFNDAVAALVCGISGPVTFDVASGTGPYNEQVTISQVGGMSLTNTVTFLGNGNTLSYNATLAAAPHTLVLNGSDFFRFNDLNVVGTGATYALVGHLWNNANDNKFTNCTFTAPANGIATTQAAFSISGSATTANTTGASGNNNELLNCTMTNGYYGCAIVGNSAGVNTGNKVTNCAMRDQYFYASFTSYQNGMIISGNTIDRLTRTTLGTTYNGIYLSTGCTNANIEKNTIRNTWAALPASTGTNYCIYQAASATLGNENKFINNLMSDINFNGTIYGFYAPAFNYMKIYHNTISLDQTSASGATTITYGIFTTGTLGLDIQNNNVSITRGGSGLKYCVYFNSLTGVISNYNNLYVNAVSGVNCVGFYLAGFPDMIAWKAGNGNIWDQQSVSADPGYANPAVGNYQPTNVVLDNIGGNLGITTDITGATRTTTPDPGCYEFTVSLLDVGALSFSSPGTSGCYTITENISVTIKNFGAATIDFAVDQVTVTCDVSGAVTTSLTANPVGTLAPGATMLVTFATPLDMTVNGVYSFNAYTTLVGDGNGTNDALSSPAIRTVGPVGGTVTTTLPQICVSGTPTLNVTGANGGAIQWQESNNATGPWTNIGTGTNSYTPPAPLTQTTYYQVEVSCNGNLGYSNVATVTVNNPQILSTTPGSRCGIGTVNLDAIVDPGLSVKWYSSPTGGAPLFTGAPFTTPTISATTTYYAEALAGIGGADSVAAPAGGTTGVNHHMFVFNSPTGMTLNAIGINSNLAFGTLTSWDVYYRPDNYQLTPGANTSATGWILLSSVTNIPSAGTLATEYTFISLGLSLSIPPGASYSFYIAPATGTTHRYNTTALGVTAAGGNANGTFIGGNRGSALFNCTTSGGLASVRFKYSLGCVGVPRVPVIATVNAAPAITASVTDPVLCPGLSTTISVSSPNDPDYTYLWTSSIGGFTANGAGPHTVSPLATTTYTVNAIDNTAGPYAGCANSASVTVITAPAVLAGTVSANLTTICVSGSPILSVTGSAAGNIQWQESTVSATGPFTNVGTGTTTYSPGVITQTTYYQVEVSCNTTVVQSNVVTVTVNNPAIISTTPGTRCGYGTVLLDATPELGAVVKWFDAATGGIQVGVGNSLTSPPIPATTTFYAEASTGGGSGSQSPIQVTEMDLGTDRLEIQNVSPDPIDVTGWKVAVSNSYTLITSVNANIQVLSGIMNPGATMSWTDAAAGPNYWGSNILWNPGAGPTFTGWAALLDNNNVLKDIVFTNWPAATIASASIVVGTATITVGSLWSGDGINTTTVAATNGVSRQGIGDNNNASDFSIIPLSFNTTNPGMTVPFTGFGCQGTRVPVIATVTPPPSISASATTNVICANTSTTLSVSSPNDPDYTYTWNPGGLIGASVNVSPNMTTTYTVTAIDNTAGPNAGCGNVATVTITVNPILVSIAPTATPSALCEGGNVNLAANALSPGYTMNGACTTGFIDISATGTDIDVPANIVDDSEHNIAIPAFTFDGITYTNARIGTNGVIALGSIAGEIAPGNGPIPSGVIHTAGNVLLAPFSDDLYPTIGTSSSIKTQSIGSTFIIQWTNLSHFDDSLVGTVTFQVQLDAITGVVTFVYNDVIFGNQIMDEGASATVGIQMSATNGIQYSLNTASLSNGQCISFTPNTYTVSWAGPNSFTSSSTSPTLTGVTSLEGGTYTVTATGSNGCITSSIVNVTVNKVRSTIQGTCHQGGFLISCHGGNNGNINLTPFGGTAPYSYLWSNSATSQNISGLTAGLYTVTITDAIGCTGSNYLNMHEPPAMTSTISSPIGSGGYNVSCPGANDGAINLTVSGGDADTVIIEYEVEYPSSGGGTYCADCGGNCQWIAIPRPPTFEPYIYNWSNGATTQNLTGVPAGIYTVTATDDNGCTSTNSITLTEPLLPCNTTLNLNLFIEGYWDGASAMLPVLLNQGEPFTSTQCDHITVELISPATVLLGPPYTADYTTTAMLNTNGTASAVFTSAVSGNYYIVIKHRNALQTWSANPQSFPLTASYSFISAATQAYGANQMEVATGVWALFSGDIEPDENIDLLDVAKQESDIAEFVFGYIYDPLNTNYPGVIATDINGDGNVDLLDVPTVEANLSNFIFSLHP